MERDGGTLWGIVASIAGRSRENWVNHDVFFEKPKESFFCDVEQHVGNTSFGLDEFTTRSMFSSLRIIAQHALLGDEQKRASPPSCFLVVCVLSRAERSHPRNNRPHIISLHLAWAAPAATTLSPLTCCTCCEPPSFPRFLGMMILTHPDHSTSQDPVNTTKPPISPPFCGLCSFALLSPLSKR